MRQRFKRFAIVAAAVFVILFGVEQIKGHGTADSARFAGLWAGISATLFLVSRVYHERRGIACALCDDPLGRASSKHS